MRGLKILVGTMSALILVGIILVVWGITTRMGELTQPRAMQALELPAATTVRHMVIDGDTIAILAATPTGDAIHIYDMKQGQRTGVIPLTVQEP
ncbi:MAG: DUF6476 family protein [Alphaproteobacteria bacterium]|nr:DUF6476 family protein [Alphaproteobacteria bacterium]